MNEIKPVLRQMIDNNKPHWRTETIRGAHKQLDEYEAKAEAFDAIAINIKALRKHMLNSGKSVNAKIIETDNTIKHIEAIIERADTYV